MSRGIVLLCILKFVVNAFGTSLAPIVDVKYAQYRGFFDTGSNHTHFFGIRYAAAPTGNLLPSAFLVELQFSQDHFVGGILWIRLKPRECSRQKRLRPSVCKPLSEPRRTIRILEGNAPASERNRRLRTVCF